MEEYINIDYRAIIKQIKTLNISSQYAACCKFLDLLRPYFCKYTLSAKEKYFFRIRSHLEGNGNYYFTNISELSYRVDFFNITKFGRCNCPFEAIFYCSDSPLLSLLEVSELLKKDCKKQTAYYTTSVWKMTQKLNLTPIFENRNKLYNNEKLLEVTNKCLNTIDEFKGYNKKEDLKEFHRIMGEEFTKPFSIDKSIYLFSASVSSYLFDWKQDQSEKMDGIVYPTCLKRSTVRNIGLNYAFNPLIIGFGNKIEFVHAFRSKMEKKENRVYETERQSFKKGNRFTGEIIW
jgi:hypothetical protein